MTTAYTPTARGGGPGSAASSVLSRIAIPKRATTSDLIQTVIANDVATRGAAQGVTRGSNTMTTTRRGRGAGGAAASSSTSVVAKIPSNRIFWTFVRRSIAANPSASQEPPLFLLSDTISKDALTVNQSFFQSLVAKYEESGPPADLLLADGDAAKGSPLEGSYATVAPSERRGLGGSFATNGETSPGLLAAGGSRAGGMGASQQLQFPSFLGFSGLGSSFAANMRGQGGMDASNGGGGGRLSPQFAPHQRRSFADPNGSRTDDMQFSFALPPPQRGSSNNSPTGTTQQQRARVSNDSMPSGLFLQLPPAAVAATQAGNPHNKPRSSLLTVTVATSGGQLRTFKASQPFWDHVLLLYHEMIQEQMKAESRVGEDETDDGSSSRFRKKKPSAASPRVVKTDGSNVDGAEDELALLRQVQQEDDDRIVLTVTASAYDADRTLREQRKWLKQVRSRATGGYGGVSSFDVSGDRAAGSLNASMLNGQSSVYEVDDDGDEDIAPVTSIQLLMAEWRTIVEEWDVATALSLETKKQQDQSSLQRRDGHDRSGGAQDGLPPSQRTVGFKLHDDDGEDRKEVTDNAAAGGGGRSRGYGVVDPETTSDVVQEALLRMREMEQRGGSGGSGGSGQYWIHFMNHWKVLEAQYRNYL